MATLASLMLKVGIDATDVVKAVEDIKTRFGTIGPETQKALGIVETALGAGLGIATAKVIELDSVTSKYIADTGASAEEAASAAATINEVFGHSLESYGELGAALGNLRTMLGLTQQEAEDILPVFVEFATATGQNAAGAVEGFRGILNAFNLEAEDSSGIMDLLVLSHQRYGTSVTESQRVLTRLAPALIAQNLTLEEGNGLLNLFKDAGINASIGQRLLNKAISGLPPGTNLKEFLAQLSLIEDPTLRAQAAIELFGTKGGAALANALGPGRAGLDDYTLTIAEAADATEAAADAIEGSVRNKIILALHALQSAIVAPLMGIEPFITGMASMAMAANGMARAIGFGVEGAMKENARQMLALPGRIMAAIPALMAHAAAWWATATAIIAANAPLIAIGAVIALVGLAIATNFGGLRDMLVGVFEKMRPLIDSFITAAKALADMLGKTLGGALDTLSGIFEDIYPHVEDLARILVSVLGVAFDAVGKIVEAVAKIVGEAMTQIRNLLDGIHNIARFLDPSMAAMEDMKKHFADMGAAAGLTADQIEEAWGVTQRAAQAGATDLQATSESVINGYVRQKDAAVQSTIDTINAVQTRALVALDAAKTAKEAADQEVAAAAAIAAATSAASHEIHGHTAVIKEDFVAAARAIIDEKNRLAAALTTDLGGDLMKGKTFVKDAMDKLTWAIKHPLALTRQLAAIEGALIGTKMTEALASTNPQIRTVAEQQQAILIARWEALTGKAYTAGVDIEGEFGTGLQSDPTDLRTSGEHAVNRWVAGILAQAWAAEAAGATVANRFGRALALSEPGPHTAKAIRDLKTFGSHAGERWVDGILQAGRKAEQAGNQLGAQLSQGLGISSDLSLASGGSSSYSGLSGGRSGNTIEGGLTIVVNGADDAEAVARAVRREFDDYLETASAGSQLRWQPA